MMYQKITYGQQTIEYRVQPCPHRRSKVAIHVLPDGSVQVDVPESATPSDIKQAVLKRARWVVQHQDDIKRQQALVLAREYVSGETHFYLGRRYQLKVLIRKHEYVKMLGGRIVIATGDRAPTHVRDLLQGWYRARSQDVMARRLAAMVDLLPWTKKDSIPEWQLRPMQKQWGSCSPKGRLSINTHLVKAPRECIDYVMLHELAHIKEHNHSKRFYRLLDNHMPDWRERKARLDGMAELLMNE